MGRRRCTRDREQHRHHYGRRSASGGRDVAEADCVIAVSDLRRLMHRGSTMRFAKCIRLTHSSSSPRLTPHRFSRECSTPSMEHSSPFHRILSPSASSRYGVDDVSRATDSRGKRYHESERDGRRYSRSRFCRRAIYTSVVAPAPSFRRYGNPRRSVPLDCL